MPILSRRGGALRPPPIAPALLWLCLASPGLAAKSSLHPAATAPARPPLGLLDAEVQTARRSLDRLAGNPQAIVALFDLDDLGELVSDRDAWLAAIDHVRRDPRQLPAVRAHAAWMRADLHEGHGEGQAAQAMYRELGLVTAWRILGPFNNLGRNGLDQAFIAEADPPDLAATVPATAAGRDPIAWRLLPQALTQSGIVEVGSAFAAEADLVAYAATWVRVDAAQPVALRTGSSGALKVWLNGREVITQRGYRPFAFDQDAAPARLQAGWNRLLVKVCSSDAGLRFLLRITRPDGSPLPALRSTSEPDGQAGFATSSEPHAVAPGADTIPSNNAALPIAHLRVALALAAGRDDPEALESLGAYLADNTPDDNDEAAAAHVLEQAATRAPTLRRYYRLAMAVASAETRRQWLERAVAPPLRTSATPLGLARALTALCKGYLQAQRPERGEPFCQEALQVAPGYLPAALARVELISDRGLPALAQTTLARLIEQSIDQPIGQPQRPLPLALLRAQARLDERRGARDLAVSGYRRILAFVPLDQEALRGLYRDARDRGDVQAALAALDRLEQLRPGSLALALDRSELLEGASRLEEATACLSRALEIAPGEPRLTEQLGRLQHRQGRDRQALTTLQRALALRPQNPELRSYLDYLQQHPALAATAPTAKTAPDAPPATAPQAAQTRGLADLIREFGVPLDEVIRRPRPALSSAEQAQAPARVLFDQEVTRVHPNGLRESYTQRVLEILNERGAKEENDFDIRYAPSTQTVEVKSARIYKKTGRIIEAVAQSDRDLSEPWYGLYYDLRAQTLTFSQLAPGDVIAVEYVVADTGQRNEIGDYFGAVHYLQEAVPRLDTRYVLVVPKTRTLYFNSMHLPGIEKREEVRGDQRIYRYAARNVPQITLEPGMPGLGDVAAYVHVSTCQGWPEVAALYRHLVREQLTADAAIREAAAQATAGVAADDEPEKIRRLYALVVEKTRYVGLEFGIHGYKPYRVSQVFARKFGDCKDKASLLLVLLRQAGIPAMLALARTRLAGDIDPYPASLAPFNHALVYVPRYNLYLDGTAEFTGSTELPAQDQDIPVLLVPDPDPAPATAGQRNVPANEPRFARTPVLMAQATLERRTSHVRLEPSGQARVALDILVKGELAPAWRSHYQTPGQRQERFEQAENATHPGAHVLRADFTGLGGIETPVAVHAELTTLWARPNQRELGMPVLGREGELLKSYARLSEREQDLVLGVPYEQQEEVTVVLPAGFSPVRLPAPRRIETPFGQFSLTVMARGNEVLASARLTVLRHRIRPAEYPAFRKFCLAVDEAVSQTLVLGSAERAHAQ